MAECLRTAVRFRPSPPNNQTTLAVVFLFVDLARMRTTVPGSLKSSGMILNMRFLHGPKGEIQGCISSFPPSPPITKVTVFRWPFLLADLVLNLNRYGFTKIARSNFEHAFSAWLRRSEIQGCIS